MSAHTRNENNLCVFWSRSIFFFQLNPIYSRSIRFTYSPAELKSGIILSQRRITSPIFTANNGLGHVRANVKRENARALNYTKTADAFRGLQNAFDAIFEVVLFNMVIATIVLITFNQLFSFKLWFTMKF